MADKKKRFLVVGLGNFGFAVAEKLSQLGHEVIAVDLDADAIDRIGPIITRAAVADATSLETLRMIGGDNVDAAIVSTGDDITASILAVLALQDLKIREIFVKVISNDHRRVMEKLGVTETVFPERDSALGLAAKICGKSLLKYLPLGTNFSIQEMGIPNSWVSKSIGELEIRQKFDITILAIHDILTDTFHATPGPDYRLKESDTLFVAGSDDSLKKIARID